jgi:hypothetical protein
LLALAAALGCREANPAFGIGTAEEDDGAGAFGEPTPRTPSSDAAGAVADRPLGATPEASPAPRPPAGTLLDAPIGVTAPAPAPRLDMAAEPGAADAPSVDALAVDHATTRPSTPLRDAPGVLPNVDAASAADAPLVSGGLKGEYFDRADFSSQKHTRVDPTISFDWDLGAPAPGVGDDYFSVRWTGFVVPNYSETYSFHVASDDGARLWIDGVLIIDKWVSQPLTAWTGQRALTAGKAHAIKLEYFDEREGATVHLRWSSRSQSKQVIPPTALVPR